MATTRTGLRTSLAPEPSLSREAGNPRAGWVLALGAALWGAVFSVASALYPWSVANGRLFTSLMAVAVALITTCVATAYLRGLDGRVLWKAALTALLWPAMCVALDFLVLSLRPPRLSLGEYVQTTGLLYLMIPVIVLGLCYQRVRVEPARTAGGIKG
jgi:hypothetical protein